MLLENYLMCHSILVRTMFPIPMIELQSFYFLLVAWYAKFLSCRIWIEISMYLLPYCTCANVSEIYLTTSWAGQYLIPYQVCLPYKFCKCIFVANYYQPKDVTNHLSLSTEMYLATSWVTSPYVKIILDHLFSGFDFFSISIPLICFWVLYCISCCDLQTSYCLRHFLLENRPSSDFLYFQTWWWLCMQQTFTKPAKK